MKEIKKLSEKYTEFNEDLDVSFSSLSDNKQSSYSQGRKKAANIMSDISNLPFHSIVFRAGWVAKNLHSAFDYIFNSMNKDDTCAHTLSGWTSEVEEKFIGGFSPRFEAIKTDRDKAKNMMALLFLRQEKFIGGREIKLLFSSLLRFYADFLKILESDTQAKFSDLTSHPLVFRVESARNDLNISNELFKTWQNEIRKDFVQRNYMALPIGEVDSETLIDGRSVVGFLKQIDKSARATYTENMLLKEKVDSLLTENEDLKKSMEDMKHNLNTISKQMGNMVHVMKEILSKKDNCEKEDIYEEDTIQNDTSINLDKEGNESDNISSYVTEVKPYTELIERLKVTHLKSIIFDYYDLQYEKLYNEVSDGLKTNSILSSNKRIRNTIQGIENLQPEHLSNEKFIDKPTDPN